MGALHEGHLSLIREARKQCEVVVCSIFINPTQFNDKKDLERYPRTPEADFRLLEQEACDAVFFPDVSEIYPSGFTRKIFPLGRLERFLEGEKRPGHFQGVAEVVKRLFEIVEPHKAFFGSKDYQQVMIIRKLVELEKMPVEIIPCAILREPDGLAMSSRNTLLSPDERKAAALIPFVMKGVKQRAEARYPPEAIQQWVATEIARHPLLKLDYLALCHPDTLEVADSTSGTLIALIAVYSGKIRLIDNLPLN